MGLTTSRESIERHVCPVETEPERDYPMDCEEPPVVAESQVAAGIRLGMEGVPSLPQSSSKKRRADSVKPGVKKKLAAAAAAAGETPKRRLEGSEGQRKRKKSAPGKNGVKSPSATSGPKRAVSKKEAAPPGKDDKSKDGMDVAGPEPLTGGAERQPMNAHRFKIRMGKEALAAIKEGTRIYIKSGEGNGGDTWWDSGVIRKIHERGKRYEVEWASHNNRGEEVDTAVERRIGLPVTYSLAGAAAEAVREAEPGTQAAILARKGVLAEARIGSWCIKHPEEAWGMLDPFGEDSTMI